MGRKIPGRKHRGVKDPEKQALARLNSIKDKINAPPSNPDVQEVSKTLQRVINLKNKTKSGEFKIKTKKRVKINTESNNNGPKINKNIKDSRFQQLPNETDRQYLNRVNKICQNVTREAAFENKYGVEIKRNEEGEIKVEKRPKDELELLIKKVRKEKAVKKVKKKKAIGNEVLKLTKSQKWQKKKNEKKFKKKLKIAEEVETRKDPIKFGEIVHAPPTLTAPKKVQKVTTPRPGQKKLLLTAIMEKSGKEPKKQAAKDKVVKKTIDKKGKRKDLPNALRRQLDKQQKEVVDAYKSLKAKKHTS